MHPDCCPPQKEVVYEVPEIVMEEIKNHLRKAISPQVTYNSDPFIMAGCALVEKDIHIECIFDLIDKLGKG